MEDGPEGVHEHHGGGEVEEAAGHDQDVAGEIIRLANHQPVDVEVEARRVEDDQAVEAKGSQPAQQDYAQADLTPGQKWKKGKNPEE